MKPNLKPPKLDRKTLLVLRYVFMKEAFKIDGGACQSPFHKDVVAEYGKQSLGVKVKDVHHLASRTNTGEFDGVEFLITLCRLEHEFCENGTAKMAGREYEWLILHLLRKSTKNRWNLPRELIEKKILPERLEIIRRIK